MLATLAAGPVFRGAAPSETLLARGLFGGFRMKRVSLSLSLSLSFALIAAPAFAGVVDSPLPELLPGEATYHLYTVPFVTREGTMETIFACTSTDSAPMQVCVETFASLGQQASNDCSSTSLNVAPSATVKFATNPTTAISVNSVVQGPTSGGSARILATSKKLVCTAFLVDGFTVPPSMMHLTIIAKKKQKGD